MPIANKNSPDESIIAPSIRLFHVHVKRSKPFSCIIPDIFHFDICANESIRCFCFHFGFYFLSQTCVPFFSSFSLFFLSFGSVDARSLFECYASFTMQNALLHFRVVCTKNALAYFTFCNCYFSLWQA